jgi:hypothetical protein
MPRSFTVDRGGLLSDGTVIDLARHDDLDPPQLQTHVDDLFPAGVSSHGNGYFLSGDQQATGSSANIELIFEFVRRARFPQAPSRFASVFGCESEADARGFASHPVWGSAGAKIWEVESEDAFRADMSCLTLGGTILTVSLFAERYWSGLENGIDLIFPDPQRAPTPPFWELLLTPPVKVLGRVA